MLILWCWGVALMPVFLVGRQKKKWTAVQRSWDWLTFWWCGVSGQQREEGNTHFLFLHGDTCPMRWDSGTVRQWAWSNLHSLHHSAHMTILNINIPLPVAVSTSKYWRRCKRKSTRLLCLVLLNFRELEIQMISKSYENDEACIFEDVKGYTVCAFWFFLPFFTFFFLFPTSPPLKRWVGNKLLKL